MRLIGVISPFLSGFYLGRLVAALYARVRADGNALLLIRAGALGHTFSSELAMNQVDAWICLLEPAAPELLESLVAAGRPVATIGTDYGLPGVSSVRSDNRAGIRMAMEHLYAQGHRRFAFLGPCAIGDIFERRNAFSEFLHEHEDCAEAIVMESESFDFGAARSVAQRLLESDVQASAWIAGTDVYALAAVLLLRSRGVRVPEDVSVVGFDNAEYTRSPEDGISTLDQRLSLMASRAYDELIVRLKDPSKAPEHVLCQPLFIPRHSTGAPEVCEDRAMVDRDAALAFATVFEEIGQFYEGGREAYLKEYLNRLEQRLRFACVSCLVENESQVLTRHFVSLQAVMPDEKQIPTVSTRDYPAGCGNPVMQPRAGDFLAIMPQGQIDVGQELLTFCFGEENFGRAPLAIEMLVHELEMLGRQLRAQGVSDDLARALTTLKTTQEALLRSEKHASLGTVIAGIAHELNTPLGNALLSVSTLTETADELRQKVQSGEPLRRSDVEGLLNAVDVATSGVEKGLGKALKVVGDFKRIGGEHFSAQPEKISVPIFMHDLISVLRMRTSQAGIQLNYIADAQISIETRPQLLSQVIVELVENALIHGFSGQEGEIEVRAGFQGEKLQIRVADSGVGISAEEMQKVFDPFYTTRMGTASGLGLTMVNNLVTGPLKGWVWAEQAPLGGTCFVVELPR